MYFIISGPHVVRESFDDNEVVVVNLNSGSYYSLEKVAAEIWNLIEAGAALDEIVSVIGPRYEEGRDEITAAVMRFFHELQQEDLILPFTQDMIGKGATRESAQEAGKWTTKLPFEAPVLQKYTDMQELLVLDPIHEVDDSGWPKSRAGSAKDESIEND
jgi:hypothetical protein